MKPDELKREISRRHREACARKEDSYLDPITGYTVMTNSFLKNRGYCCKSGCRHCPYGFRAQKSEKPL